MLVRIGLVFAALILVALVALGVGAGMGIVRLSPTGIAFGREEEIDTNADKTKIISVDDLLKQAAAKNLQQAVAAMPPTAGNPSPMPVAIAPNISEPAHAQTSAQVASPNNAAGRDAGRPLVAAGRNGNGNADPSPAILAAAMERAKGSGIIRVVAGRPQALIDADGNLWEGASGFDGGNVEGRGDIHVDNSRISQLYHTERWGMTGWHRRVPNGSYTVLLHFAETWDGVKAPGQRVFSVEVQGIRLSEIDPFKETGGLRRELIRSARVKVRDGALNIKFIKTDKNSPEINGIEVIPDGPPDGTAAARDDRGRRATDVRINAGAAVPITDPTGAKWDPDTGFDGGQTVDRGQIDITNTAFPDIYRTERYAMSAWHKELPNGKYAVNLHFAETFDGIKSPGERVFHVVVQGQELRNFDVFKESGGLRRALVKTFHVTVADGKLLILFQATEKNAPEINGIEVIAEQ